ncbi:hypothetical protein BE221DRAFT_74090, partial [Ostreococcus tauri]
SRASERVGRQRTCRANASRPPSVTTRERVGGRVPRSARWSVWKTKETCIEKSARDGCPENATRCSYSGRTDERLITRRGRNPRACFRNQTRCDTGRGRRHRGSTADRPAGGCPYP